METEFILQHGWGFDATSWSKWLPSLAQRGRVILGERGYFGARKVTPAFTPNATRKIVVAHSFGAHLVPQTVMQQADAIVLVAAFLELQANARAIRAMQRKFPAAPDIVITDFWRNCYAPEYDRVTMLPPPGMNETALEDDLAALGESVLDLQTLAAAPQLILIQPDSDRIVPDESRLHLRSALPNASVADITGGSHAVHLTQSERCLQFVVSLASRNQKEACQIQKS